MFSEIHDNIFLPLGIKNFVELEAELSMREFEFKVFNRSDPVLPVHKK